MDMMNARAFLTKLIDDPDFQERFKANPKRVLKRFGVDPEVLERAPPQIPALPSEDQLRKLYASVCNGFCPPPNSWLPGIHARRLPIPPDADL